MTTRNQKVAFLKQAVNMAVTVDYIKQHVSDVVSEVVAGKWPDATPLTVVLTVGDAKAIGGFWLEQWVVTDVAACLVGRTVRALMINSGVKLTPEESVDILMSTNPTEQKATDLLLVELKRKLGDVPVNHELSKKKRAELDLLGQRAGSVH